MGAGAGQGCGNRSFGVGRLDRNGLVIAQAVGDPPGVVVAGLGDLAEGVDAVALAPGGIVDEVCKGVGGGVGHDGHAAHFIAMAGQHAGGQRCGKAADAGDLPGGVVDGAGHPAQGVDRVPQAAGIVVDVPGAVAPASILRITWSLPL